MAVAEPQASSRIFISYRREDAIAHVNALFHPLRERFGEDRIFKDTDGIAPGQDFLKVIQSQLESCSVLLAVIGSKWLTVQKPKSNVRRLDDPTDYLRVEVATALKNEKVRVIPILVGQASMPAPEDLPVDLAELARRNGFELRDSRWDSDVRLLIQAIERACGEPASAGPKPPPVPPSEPPPLAPPSGPLPSHDSGEFDLLEVRRKRQIAEHVKVARQTFEALDYEAVLEACEKAVWLDPQHGEARDLARRARRALDEKKIQGWLPQARQLLAREELTDADLATASELIDQTLSLNATHEAAVKLRQEVLALRKQRERQREVDRQVRAALVRAQSSFDEEDFDAAIEHCDDALADFGESAKALELRSKAVAAKDEERRQRELKRRALQVVKDARAEFAAGQQEAALARLEQFSPPHDLIAREKQERERLQAPAATSAATPAHRIEPKDSVAENVGTTAPPPQTSRTIYIAGGAAVVLLLTLGTWWAMTHSPATAPPASQPQVSQPPGSSLVQGPGQAANPGGDVTPKVPDNLGQPTEAEQPTPVDGRGSKQLLPVDGRGSEPPANPAIDPAQLRTLQTWRSTASQLLQAGQRVQALDAAAAGLKIDPKDPALNAVMSDLLRDAQAGAQRSKQGAMALDASDRAEEAFNQGLQKERQAVSMRRTGRIDAATRSFWGAADQFKAAAVEARRIAEEEEEEATQAKLANEKVQLNKKEEPPPRIEPKSLNPALEQPVVTQTLRRYEAAYANLSADDVRSVYPSAPIDQLAKDFAGYRSYSLKVQIDEFKFYAFSEARTSVVVTGRVSHDILPKSGQRTQVVRSQIFTLEKQGTTWIIVQIR